MRALRLSLPRRGGGGTRLALAAAPLLCGAALVPADARAQVDIVMCTGQPVPTGYAVVRAFRGDQCPNYYQGTHNALTIRLPGDTVTVCAELTPQLAGYVVTGRFRSDACPNYYGASLNGARWRRLPAAEPQEPPPPGYDRDGVEIMEGLDEYGRYVQRQLRAAEERLRLSQATHLPWAGAAPLNGYTRLRLRREAGEPLTAVAVCDQDCGEIVLRVMSPDGAVAAAGEAGPESVVRLPAAAQAGGWTVQATVRACTAEFCRFAVGVYQTPPDAGVPPRRPPLPRPSPRPAPRP
jgi:hypothetical protein